MTFRIVQIIDAATVAQIVETLNEDIEPKLYADVSNYAAGRMRAWLNTEPPLFKDGEFRQGIHHNRIWNYLRRICKAHDFEVETALVSKGGEITRHRDATYADYRAFGLNLGNVKFHYEPCYPSFRYTKGAPSSCEPEVYELTGGELFEFNCKNPHWVSNVDPQRWGINMWHISYPMRKAAGL